MQFDLVAVWWLNIGLCKVGVPFVSDVSLDIVNQTGYYGGIIIKQPTRSLRSREGCFMIIPP